MNKEETSFITINTRLPRYLPYPAFLLRMDLSQTAKVVYALLLDRTTLSQKSGWTDGDGNVYVIYPIEQLSEASGKCTATIKAALSELQNAGLIERKRTGFSSPHRIYVKLPPYSQKVSPHTARKLAVIEPENYPLSTECNKYKSNNVVSGQKMIHFPIPDYDCEEGASL